MCVVCVVCVVCVNVCVCVCSRPETRRGRGVPPHTGVYILDVRGRENTFVSWMRVLDLHARHPHQGLAMIPGGQGAETGLRRVWLVKEASLSRLFFFSLYFLSLCFSLSLSLSLSFSLSLSLSLSFSLYLISDTWYRAISSSLV